MEIVELGEDYEKDTEEDEEQDYYHVIELEISRRSYVQSEESIWVIG